ncbi:Alg9-like mannosyltransferase family-domain-containing protein [Ganoderma leucocontextum]|nr:Alg9-like mannosyltransferase family-domain-containing protein [Ganoderma leucocontextum]
MINRTLLALAIRVAISLGTWTFFQPDEYFQSLEVAHHAVFGYGQLTWEWRGANPIRSIVYPGWNIPVYWLLKVLKLDHTTALVWGPKLLHGVIAAGTDIWLLRLTRKVAGERYVNVAFYLSLLSLFHGLSLSRSISNSAETSLTTIALSYFPWDIAIPSWRTELRTASLYAAVACAMRPTNAIIWVYAFAWLLWRLRKRPRDILLVLINALFTGAVVFAVMVALDTKYYGKLTFTSLNFLLTNASSVSLFYGRSPWHYYLTQALPLLCLTSIFWVGKGAYLSMGPAGAAPLRALLGLVAWTVSVYSLAGHKEWRFIHPLLPPMHILAAKALVDASSSSDGKTGERRSFPFRPSHLVLLLSLPLLGYVMLFHGRAQIDVVHYLRTLPIEQSKSIGFLMPCHSTPWQAYLHRPDLAQDGDGALWALGCEPPLQGQDVFEYKDQTDVFYENPVRYLDTHFPQDVDPTFPPSPLPRSRPGVAADASYPWRHEWPQNVVFFGALLEQDGVHDLLGRLGYEPVWYKGSLWEEDSRRRGGVQVWRYRPAK